MLRFVLQRVLVASVRFLAVAGGLLLLTEVSFSFLGGARGHAWDFDPAAPPPAELASPGTTWGGLLAERGWASARVLFLATSATLLVGYAWGILGARFRRQRLPRLLAAPFAALACAPGFWLVALVAVFSYFRWQRPGFADDLLLEETLPLMAWWNAAVVALPAAVAGISWQILAVSRIIEGETSAPWLRGLFVAGVTEEAIFYRHALRRARPALLALADTGLPATMGALVVLEPAFRFPGMGSLLVEGVKQGHAPAVFAVSLCFVGVATGATLLRELLAPASVR